MEEFVDVVEEFEAPKSESEIAPPEEAASTLIGSVAAAATGFTSELADDDG